ncbi:uncharacterized transporter Esbp6p [[Candida] railenensis]|uniref:Uncharacterized transporter Esbp6p n=1 Tax=[Candida] railenensis TaxID=45579 RepID=A0A9P0QR68_9ASCO|nr:uncharacterized transporter Esbp6p [[Candida] railenensis]
MSSNQNVEPTSLGINVTSKSYDPYHLDRATGAHCSESRQGFELSSIYFCKRDNTQEVQTDYLPGVEAEYSLARSLTCNEGTNTERSSIPIVNSTDQAQKSKSTSDLENQSESSNCDDKDPPKDEGFAWVVAVCAMLAVFCTWGSNAGYGVFLSYYISSDTFAGATRYDYALIGGMILCFAQLLAPVCALCYRVFGPFYTSYFGVVLQTLGYLLASFATKRWQLYCTQGFLVGVSFSFVYLPGTLMISTWFEKRKATAMGIAFSGVGLGGVFFSLVVRKIISETGDQRWALRMSAFVAGSVALIACSIMKPRNYKPLPFKLTLSKEFIYTNAKYIFSVSVFKDYALVLLGVWFGICTIGYMLVLFTISSYGISVGLSAYQGSILTAVLNAGQVIGRPSCGLVADKFGRFNFAIVNCLVITVLILAFWINATSFGSLLAFSVLMGSTIGVGSLFCQSLASDILQNMENLPAAWSGLNMIVSLFSIGTEVFAFALKKDGATSPYLHTQIFGGVCFFFSALLLCVMREKVVKMKFVASLDGDRKLHREKASFKESSNDTSQVDIFEVDKIQLRIDRYELLTCNNSIKSYFVRMFYPIKV